MIKIYIYPMNIHALSYEQYFLMHSLLGICPWGFKCWFYGLFWKKNFRPTEDGKLYEF